MATPSTRQGLIDYCLRKLGEPVIEINVDEDQIEDRVDEAFQLFNEYHMDGSYKTYIKHEVTQDDIDNEYITIDDSILTVSRVLPFFSTYSTGIGMFNINYQMHLQNITDMYNYWGDLAYYNQIQGWLELLDMQLNGTPQVNFSRRQNRLYIFGDFNDGDLRVGSTIVMEVYTSVSPTGTGTSSSIYNDMFLKEMLTVLIKEQWGQNLIKFEGMQLPGGVQLNGRQILEDALNEKEKLLERLRLEFEQPVDFFIG